MGAFFKALLSSDESVADSIVIAGLACAIVLCGMTIYAGASLWNPISFGTGAATILGAVGAAKRVRDGGQQP